MAGSPLIYSKKFKKFFILFLFWDKRRDGTDDYKKCKKKILSSLRVLKIVFLIKISHTNSVIIYPEKTEKNLKKNDFPVLIVR